MHPEDIRADIRKKFGSMAELCRKLNLNTHAVPHAISRPGYSRRIEREIAKAIGKTPHQVFPNRYFKNGKPISARMVLK